MSYKIAGIDVHKKVLAVVVSNVEIETEYQFETLIRARSVVDRIRRFDFVPCLIPGRSWPGVSPSQNRRNTPS
jgi:hypothetical protein